MPDDEFRVDSFWISQMHTVEYFSPIIDPYKVGDRFEYLTMVSIFATDSVYRNYVFVPDPDAKAVDTADAVIAFGHKAEAWEDLVGATLRDINIYPENCVLSRGTYFYRFTMEFNTRNIVTGSLSATGPSHGSGKLCHSLLVTLYRFINASKSEGLKQFIDYETLEAYTGPNP
ncbi:MAG: hypothetical protein K8I60_07265 [Anaerolineae bacterium]|nr:hypothetical protein [Anaerolineae bacterium]